MINKDCITFYLSYLYLKVRSIGMSMMSLAESSLLRKCSETVVGYQLVCGVR